MQDPYFAVKEEVEHSVVVVAELHAKWTELANAGRGSSGDELEWTSSELLSGLRSIEWDLQDLEDTVSIVEGNRQKFLLSEDEINARKDFIDATRRRVNNMREEVVGLSSNDTPGFSVKKGPALPTIGKKGKGYGKVGSEEEMPAAVEDAEAALPAQHMASGAADEILGADAAEQPAGAGRHRRKKQCIGACLLLLAIGGIAAALLGGGGGSGGGDDDGGRLRLRALQAAAPWRPLLAGTREEPWMPRRRAEGA